MPDVAVGIFSIGGLVFGTLFLILSWHDGIDEVFYFCCGILVVTVLCLVWLIYAAAAPPTIESEKYLDIIIGNDIAIARDDSKLYNVCELVGSIPRHGDKLCVQKYNSNYRGVHFVDWEHKIKYSLVHFKEEKVQE